MIRDFRGKTAVITGAASGIGLALAERAAAEGMRLLLADLEEEPLEAARENLEEGGAEVLALCCDVSRAGDVEKLLQQGLSRFGTVHLLCNNAGVLATGSSTWETPLADWEWVLGVNLWGVIHGVRLFLPEMMQQEQGHILNTASLAGMISVPEMGGPYNVSKHGIVTLSETLYNELRNAGSPLGVSVLCPGVVDTRLPLAERNRPPQLSGNRSAKETEELLQFAEEVSKEFFAAPLQPATVADRVFAAVRENRFYVFTHSGSEKPVEKRMRAILEGSNPEVAGLAEFPDEGPN